MLVQIGRGRTQAEPDLAQPARLQWRVLQVTYADRQIPALIKQVDAHIGQAQIHRHRRIALAEQRQQRGNAAQAKGQRHVHAQHAAGIDALRGRLGFGLVDIGKDALAGLEVSGAGIGQCEPARAAMKQAHAQPRFQRIHMARGHGR